MQLLQSQTALTVASAADHDKIVKLLSERGADADGARKAL